MADPVLEEQLRDLADHLDVPQVDLVPTVRARLADPIPMPRRPGAWRGARLRVAAAVVALLVVATSVLALSTGAREAVADWFGLDGVEITRDDRTAPVGADLGLGTRTSLEDAADAAGFAPLLPLVDEYGEPDAVFTAPSGSGVRITLVYEASDGLPALDDSGIGMLVTELRADPDVPAIRKDLGSSSEIEELTVGGEPGFWFDGAPHVVTFADEDGRFTEEASRLGGNTLLWERSPLTLRIESALGKAETVRIAEAMEA